MTLVILLLVAFNAVAHVRYCRSKSVANTELLAELLVDVAALTAQLYFSGGATNPFISLYLLQVILGAILLVTWSTWVIVAVTSACYLWLTFSYRSMPFPDRRLGEFFDLHIHGMFICFLLAAILLVFFIGRINRNLRNRDEKLAKLRQQSAAEDHIVRMGLLASGAAHQLGTPLATLSVILNDWERMPLLAGSPEVAQDIAEMQAQLSHCKAVVSEILMSAGEVRGEGTVRTTVNAFLDDAVGEWRATRSSAPLAYRNDFGDDVPIVSDAALKHILFNVFDNALEASSTQIGVSVQRAEDQIVITVDDDGVGFDPEILAELGRPYRSSKSQPSGVGLFLVVNVVRKLGGTVTAENRPSGGASLRLALPLASLAGESCHGG